MLDRIILYARRRRVVLCRALRPSVRLSVRPLHIRLTLWKIFLNLGQIFALLKRRADVIFQQCPTKVKVTLRGQSSKDNISCPLHISKTVEDLSINFVQIWSIIRRCAGNWNLYYTYICMKLYPFENFTMEIVSAQELWNPLRYFHEPWYKVSRTLVPI